MTSGASLAEQRLELRGQLRAQRQEVAEQLFASRAQGQFPRSATMRLFTRQPALVGRLVTLLAGARLAGAATAFFVVVEMVRASRGRSSPP